MMLNGPFHKFQKNLLPKECPVYTLVSRLVIHAAGEFDEEDYSAVTSYIATKKGIKTKLEWLDHFYFNRELWKERVRTYPPPAKKEAARIHGDLRFTAARMKVRCPPLHIAHPAERKIWRDFLKSTPSPGCRDWCALAKICKEKTDRKTVFLKLPGMLRVYYSLLFSSRVK
jgi:hypothetical protein